MSKERKRSARKYNPKRAMQRMANEMLLTTFFYHVSSMVSPNPQVGNYKFPISVQAATWMLNCKNTWSGVVLAFCEHEGERYVKSKFFTIDTHITRADMCARLDTMQIELVRSCNTSHICSAGFFIVPDWQADIESQHDEIISLLEQHAPYSYAVTALASLQRSALMEAKKEHLAAEQA